LREGRPRRRTLPVPHPDRPPVRLPHPGPAVQVLSPPLRISMHRYRQLHRPARRERRGLPDPRGHQPFSRPTSFGSSPAATSPLAAPLDSPTSPACSSVSSGISAKALLPPTRRACQGPGRNVTRGTTPHRLENPSPTPPEDTQS